METVTAVLIAACLAGLAWPHLVRSRGPYFVALGSLLVALVIQGLAASLLFLASVFISIGGGETAVQECYNIMVNLTILVYFVPYLYLFAAWITLRRSEPHAVGHADAMTLPGGMTGVWLIAVCGFAATLIAIGLVFVPPPDTENVLNYEANLIGQSALLFIVGFVFYAASRRR